jgi:hypothetical protein
MKQLPNKINVRVIAAKHDDVISDRESVGFVFDFDGTVLIYTGDTGWNNETIIKQYTELGKELQDKHIVLLAHIGGFKRYEDYYVKPEKGKDPFYKNHLGRLGLGCLVEAVKPDVCLISEFGEELRQHRMELVEIYSKIWGESTTFFPADIGLIYDLRKKEVYGIKGLDLEKYECSYGFISPDQVKTCLLRKDYSLHYFDAKASFKESDLIQVLIEQFDRSSRMTKAEDRHEHDLT